MSDYHTPKTPPDTPPVIDPDVDPKTAAEMEEDGEAEGEPLGHRTDQSEIDTERPDDAGENSRRALRSAPLLPPD